MRRTLTAVAATAALTLALAGPAAAKGKPGWAGPGLDTTTVETAIALSGVPFEFDGDAGDFDILVAAVVATGADGILDGSTDFTVFAPTDQAFLDLASVAAGATITDEGEAFGIVASLGIPAVTDVLLYHVTPDWRPSPSVLGAKSITMADGNTISAKTGTLIAANGEIGLVALDVKTADGGIHVIDTVMLPPAILEALGL